MSRIEIVAHGDSAAIILTPQMLASLGARIGDAVDASADKGQIVLRPCDDDSRKAQVESLTNDLFERRRDAYQRLA